MIVVSEKCVDDLVVLLFHSLPSADGEDVGRLLDAVLLIVLEEKKAALADERRRNLAGVSVN